MSWSRGDVNRLDFRKDFSADSPLIAEDGPVIKACLILRDALCNSLQGHLEVSGTRYNSQSPSAQKAHGGQPGDPITHPAALIQRHWYTTARQTVCDSSGCPWISADFEPIRLPGDVWTCGDWHLAVLEGSVGVRSGIAILLHELLTRSSAAARLVQGVGLPPHKDFYEESEHGKLPILQVNLRWFQQYVEGSPNHVIYRSAIFGYQEASPVLNGFLHAIISSSEKEWQWIRSQFIALHEILRGVFQSKNANLAKVESSRPLA